MISFGFQPIAALVLGSSASLIGALRAVFLSGLLMLTGASLLLVFRIGLRIWEISQVFRAGRTKARKSHDISVIRKMISPAVLPRALRLLYLTD
jgi:hypothetical protein